MRRLFILPAFAALGVATVMACTPEPTPQTPQETRIADTRAKIQDCADTQCVRIDLDRGDLPDFAVVAELDHVTALRMSWTDFDDLDDITAMTQLRELHLSSTQMSDLDGLAEFQNLDILHLQWSREVDDFSEIATLPRLKELALGGNDVGDMAFVASLPNLEGLSLTSGTVSSFEALRHHPSLERLDLEHTGLPDDLSPLLSLSDLRQISMVVSNLSPEQLAVVDQLRARGVEVDEIPELIVVIC